MFSHFTFGRLFGIKLNKSLLVFSKKDNAVIIVGSTWGIFMCL